jgi:hypothetical protein
MTRNFCCLCRSSICSTYCDPKGRLSVNILVFFFLVQEHFFDLVTHQIVSFANVVKRSPLKEEDFLTVFFRLLQSGILRHDIALPSHTKRLDELVISVCPTIKGIPLYFEFLTFVSDIVFPSRLFKFVLSLLSA